MKIRSLLTIVAMLSVLLFGIGTAYAVYGVADDVPGQDLVFPVICIQTPVATNSLNTNWAIADLIGGSPSNQGFSAHTGCQISDSKSRPGPDFDYFWTPFEVVTDDCQSLLNRHPAAKITTAGVYEPVVTIDGIAYFVLYVTCKQDSGASTETGTAHAVVDRFMNNMYLVDGPQGFASGFNGPMLEGGSDRLMGENAGANKIGAAKVFARYYINNTVANSWDWLIFLMGRNQYNGSACFTNRSLQGSICDENEHCTSANFPIPNELNVISIGSTLPTAPFYTALNCAGLGGPPTPQCPSVSPAPVRAGFYSLGIQESGAVTGIGSITIAGTFNSANALCSPASTAGNNLYSIFGWSYERAAAGSIVANFDVIHPVLRYYCTPTTGGIGSAGTPTDNLGACSCTGAGC